MLKFYAGIFGWRKLMTKEYEIGLNLLRRVLRELEQLTQVEDKLTARRIVNAIVNPITASAYQIRVGEGPHKEELLEGLIKLVREMRDLSELESLRETARRLLGLLKEVENSLVESKDRT